MAHGARVTDSIRVFTMVWSTITALPRTSSEIDFSKPAASTGASTETPRLSVATATGWSSGAYVVDGTSGAAHSRWPP